MRVIAKAATAAMAAARAAVGLRGCEGRRGAAAGSGEKAASSPGPPYSMQYNVRNIAAQGVALRAAEVRAALL